MTHVEVEPGVSLYVQDVGAGPAVVLLHGWGLDHQVWDRQARVLAERGRRAVCLDLRGHGRSDAPFGDYGVDRLGEDVVRVLDALDLRDVALVGWSLGGLTAFRVASTDAQRVARLVLVGSNGVANTRRPGFPFGRPAEEQEDALVAAELGDRLAFRRTVIAGAFRSAPSASVVDWLVGLSLQAPSWVGAACLRTLLRTDQVAAAPTLAVPVVQIVGADDPVLSRRGASWLMDVLPHARQVVLGDCGHYPMIEAPDRFDEALLEAVGGQAPG